MTALLLCTCGQKPPAPTPVAPPEPSPPTDPLSASALMADLQILVDAEMMGRGSYQAGARKAADFVAAELSELGLRVVRQPVRGGAENIIAIKPGDEHAIIVSAHHDHLGVDHEKVMYPGADDNASGVAVLLALARKRASERFQHTVLFISFGAEEDGLVGSGVYVHDPAWPLEQTRGVINFDMVGRNFFESGADQEATLAVVGLEDFETIGPVLRDLSDQLGVNMIEVPARLLDLFDLQDRTDDWWFRRQRIPAIHFSTGLHEDYHQATDTLDRIVPEQMQRTAELALRALDRLAQLDETIVAGPAPGRERLAPATDREGLAPATKDGSAGGLGKGNY